MKINRILKGFSLILGIALLTMSTSAEAQYGRRHGHYHGPGPGYGPRPARGPGAFKHRFHLYVAPYATGFVTAGQYTDAETDRYLGGGGGGVGILGGLRLGPMLSLELNGSVTFHSVYEGYDYSDMFHLQVWTADAKIHIPTRSPLEPFIQGGLGYAFLGQSVSDRYGTSDYIFTEGPAWNLGGGLDLWVSPVMSIGGRLLWRGMWLGEAYYTHSVKSNFAHGLAFDVNVMFHL